MTFIKVLDWLERIGNNNISQDIVFHIKKHVLEFKYKDLEKWFNSMINLIFIYRFNQKKEILDWNNMLERLENRKNKNIEGDID